MASRFALWRGVDDASAETADVARKALMIPTLLAAVMLVIGFTAANIADVWATRLFKSYLEGSFIFTGISLLIFVFYKVTRLWKANADRPLIHVWADLKAKGALLLLPFVIFPLFYVGFTTAKTCIPFLVGYSWDGVWSSADRVLFGDDAWRISHAILGTKLAWLWDNIYSIAWGSALALFMANIALYAKPRFIGITYTAMLTTWLVGGWFMAYALSAAGPTFAYLVDPVVGKQFTPLRESLASILPELSRTRLTQRLLSLAIDWQVAIKGGGISAMPSMHLGAVSIYLLAARRTAWFGPAVAFWFIIFFLSAYLGWHYWVDGIVAFIVAYASWKFAEACFR